MTDDDRKSSTAPDPISAAQTAQLDEIKELLDLAQEAGRVGIFEWQVQTGALRLSAKFLSLYGLTQFDGRYDTWLKTIFRDDVTRLNAQIEAVFEAQQREWQAEFRIHAPGENEPRWMEARSIVFYDAQGRAARLVGVHVDITERKRSMAQLRAFTESLEEAVRERTRELEVQHEALRKAEESLRHAHKMEAVGQLTGGVAHDFNNLLTIVMGGLDIIGRQIPSLGQTYAAERIERAKTMAMQGVERAATLTSRLLAFSRRQPLAPKSVDANKLVSATCDFVRQTLGETIALETVLAAGLWRTYVDANQLENALLNLALNARDAMPDGGKVTIETANAYLDDAYVASISEPVQPGQYVMIAVEDTGSGMDKTTIEHMFEPFFTTKDVGKGTGLGSSQVYGFVRQSDGHVKVYSEPGQGTTVKLYLPRDIGKNGGEDDAKIAPADRATGNETILVAEDDADLRGYTVEILSDLGYRVLAAEHGAVALRILRTDEKIDLLFTDVVMPGGINGRQLADEAVRLRPQLKVLFTTGYTRNAIVHHGRLDAGVHMIGKPFSAGDLSAKVRSLLDSR